MSVNEKMTELADAVRELTGVTEKLSLDAMIQNIRGAISSAVISSAMGSVVNLSDSLARKFYGLTLYGKTTQNGTPTPTNPVPLKSVGADGNATVTVCGKNLLPVAISLRENKTVTANGVTYTLNDDGSYTANGTATGNSVFAFTNTTLGAVDLPAGDYIISGMDGANNNFYFTLSDGQDSSATRVDVKSASEKRVTMTSGYMYNPRMVALTGTVFNNVTFHPMIRPATIVDGTYEPYKAQTLTVSTPNGLPGIPVSSGGNYTDDKGQQWICDEIDFAKGKYVQRIGKVIFDGSEDEDWTFSTTQSGTKRFIIRIPTIMYGSASVVANLLNNQLPTITAHDIYVRSADGCACNQNSLIIHSVNIQTIDALKAHLANKPMLVMYELATPVETNLTAGDIAAYSVLHTNYPNTTIYNDEGAGMRVSYVADTKLYIDQKTAALAEAILNN